MRPNASWTSSSMSSSIPSLAHTPDARRATQLVSPVSRREPHREGLGRELEAGRDDRAQEGRRAQRRQGGRARADAAGSGDQPRDTRFRSASSVFSTGFSAIRRMNHGYQWVPYEM